MTGHGKIQSASDLTGAGDLELDFEAVVIGTGAGGAAAAAILAERGMRVVMLEEGGHHDRKDFSTAPLEMTRKLYRDSGMTTAVGVPGTPSFPIPLGLGP